MLKQQLKMPSSDYSFAYFLTFESHSAVFRVSLDKTMEFSGLNITLPPAKHAFNPSAISIPQIDSSFSFKSFWLTRRVLYIHNILFLIVSWVLDEKRHENWSYTIPFFIPLIYNKNGYRVLLLFCEIFKCNFKRKKCCALVSYQVNSWLIDILSLISCHALLLLGFSSGIA